MLTEIERKAGASEIISQNAVFTDCFIVFVRKKNTL